jgi:hypothetical protein
MHGFYICDELVVIILFTSDCAVDPQPKWARLDIMKRGVVYIPKVQGFLD